MDTQGDGLNGLPIELLGNIFQLVIDAANFQRDRRSLSLVCRQWRKCVEGTALLWTDISALHSPAYVRRALERSKGAMIDLHCRLGERSHVELEAFMVEVGPHIARWRSLVVGIRPSPSLESALAPLTTAQAPSLEVLKLFMGRSGQITSANATTLFGGAPAPPTLKHLNLRQIPVAIEPLNLSGLVSLSLNMVATISTPQLLEILLGSPELETLSLRRNPGLVAIETRESNVQAIELPKLISLSLKWIDNGGTNCILSHIRFPNRHRVSIWNDNGTVDALSVLFTSAITHLLHTTTPSADLLFSAIRVEVGMEDDCMIKFRGIDLHLYPLRGEDQIQEILRWLADGLGSEAAECPVHLIFNWSDMDPVRLAAVPTPLVIKHISISHFMRESMRGALYSAMVRPPDPTSSGWLLPQMESLSVGFDKEESQRQLVSMLKGRYEGAISTGETESRCPMNLRSVELRGKLRNEGLAEEIRGILGEVDVSWAD